MPAPTPPSRLLNRVCWFLFAAASVAMAWALLHQEVDPTNRALKTEVSAEVDNRRRLAEVVADQPTMLLAFAMRGDVHWLPNDRTRIEHLRGEVAGLAAVASCSMPPGPDDDVVLMVVALRTADPATITRLLQLARTGAPASCQVLATGLPLIEQAIAGLVAGERSAVVPRLLAVLWLSALAFYRHLGLAVAVLLPAVAAIAWTGGIVAWLGNRLDPVATLLDPVLLTIGVAASVHFVEAFRRARAEGHEVAACVQRTVAELRTPALLATVTTMIGLWSLTTSSTPAIVDFGLRAALGVALTHAFTFAMLPGWLSRFGRGQVASAAPGTLANAWVRGLLHHRVPIVFVATAVSVLAAAGLTQLRTDNDPLRLLPVDEPVRLDYEHLCQRLGGVETCDLLVPAPSPASEPARLLPLVAEIRQLPGIAGLAGPVQRGSEGDLVVPLLLRPGGSAARSKLFAQIEHIAVVLGLDTVVPAGAAVQIARDSERLMHGLLGSLGLSFALLTVAICLGLRSVRLGFAAMLPNLLPSLWLYGAFGMLHRPVSVATAMIACTMLGLIVDNTLHLLHHYRTARTTANCRLALHHAFARCGRAMSLSSVVLMLGFATAASSHLETTVEFAVLATGTIASAWIGTAVLLPLLLGIGWRRRSCRPLGGRDAD